MATVLLDFKHSHCEGDHKRIEYCEITHLESSQQEVYVQSRAVVCRNSYLSGIFKTVVIITECVSLFLDLNF